MTHQVAVLHAVNVRTYDRKVLDGLRRGRVRDVHHHPEVVPDVPDLALERARERRLRKLELELVRVLATWQDGDSCAVLVLVWNTKLRLKLHKSVFPI